MACSTRFPASIGIGANARVALGAMVVVLLTGISPASAAELRVVINGVRSDDGRLMVDVYATEEKYRANAGNGNGDYRTDVTARQGSVTAVLTNVPPGRYGATVIHDENANGKLDTNFLGIPREGVGASNNAKGSFGPPSFTDMVFAVSDPDGTITINLDY